MWWLPSRAPPRRRCFHETRATAHKHSISRGTWHPPRGVTQTYFLPRSDDARENNKKEKKCAGSPSQTEICVFVLGSVCASRSLKPSLSPRRSVSARRLAADRLHGLSTTEEAVTKIGNKNKDTLWRAAGRKTRSEWVTFVKLWTRRHHDLFKSCDKLVAKNHIA